MHRNCLTKWAYSFFKIELNKKPRKRLPTGTFLSLLIDLRYERGKQFKDVSLPVLFS